MTGAHRDRILFAVSGHGFGHATRSAAIARALRARHPGLEVTFSTSIAREVLARWDALSPGSSAWRFAEYEPGTSERTCFEVDRDATRAAWRGFIAARGRRLDEDARHMASAGYRGVVSDISALAIAAAARAGIPAVAVSNFTWDWILAPLLEGDPDLGRLPAELAAWYAPAEAYIRLPLHPAAHPFRRAVDVPLVGRKAAVPRAECRRILGLDGARPLVLVAIGGLRAGAWPEVRVPCDAFDFLVVGPLPIEFPPGRARFLPDELPGGIGFADLVGCADAALAKPGYGMCSECAVNGTPMVGIERIGFAEHAALREGMPAFVPWREIRLEDFFAGRWEPAIAEALAAPRTPPPASDGTDAAARQIALALALED